MSHFTVLVTNTNIKSVEEQLERFYEQGDPDDYFMEWVDKAKEYQHQYETEKVSEFYCASHSSWGFEITKELFDQISGSRTGAIIEYRMTKQLGNYLEPGKRYRGYYAIDDERRSRCEGDAWFEFVKIVETDRPDLNVLWQGVGLIRVIEPPKEIAMKDKYPDYETYLKDWHGVDDPQMQGYYSNPDAKWDWYQIGGRWAGFFVAKAGRDGTDGVDVIKVKDIDWAAMEQVEKDRRAKRYDEEMAKPEADRFIWEPVARTETRDEYINASVSNSTFAVLHEDVWYERGEMGWWGVVSNEVDRDEWDIQFRNLVDSLDPDSEVTVVDCHI